MISIRSGYWKLMLSMCIVGSSVVISKVIAISFPVFLASCLRFLVALVILLPYSYVTRKHTPPSSLGKRTQFILFSQAVFGVFLFNLLLLYGIQRTSAMEGGIILSTTPALIGIMAIFWLKEKWDRYTVYGILFSIAGILLLQVMSISGSGWGISLTNLSGNLLIVGAAACEAAFTILGKALPTTASPLFITTRVSLYGFLLFLPFALAQAASFPFSMVTWVEWLFILYSGIVVTVMAFLLWYQGLRQVSASTAATFTGCMPISSILLASFFLHEPFQLAHLAGVVFVMLGIFFSTRVRTESITSFSIVCVSIFFTGYHSLTLL